MILKQILILLCTFLLAKISLATSLTENEKDRIAEKLEALPVTREIIWEIFFTENSEQSLDNEFQNEMEAILKTSLLEADTQVVRLTPSIRKELGLKGNIAAFHKQGSIPFEIIPSRAGTFQDNKTNDTVRQLESHRYFTHEHNVFVEDAELSRNVNTVILLFHELSHAAYDQMLATKPENFVAQLSSMVPTSDLKKLIKRANGRIKIDGDLYDLFSERFAFELEYRLDRNVSHILIKWPRFFRYDEVYDEEYVTLIDGFVRKVYNIDHPLLDSVSPAPLDLFLLSD